MAYIIQTRFQFKSINIVIKTIESIINKIISKIVIDLQVQKLLNAYKQTKIHDGARTLNVY